MIEKILKKIRHYIPHKALSIKDVYLIETFDHHIYGKYHLILITEDSIDNTEFNIYLECGEFDTVICASEVYGWDHISDYLANLLTADFKNLQNIKNGIMILNHYGVDFREKLIKLLSIA